MSVTTTQNPRAYSIVRTLADYELHHSEEGEHEAHDPEPSAHPPPPPESSSSHLNWETEYRRVPPHRPVNPAMYTESRTTYQNNAERFFITNMFGGIMWVQRLNRIWRATGGRLNDTYFRWQVGGEY